MKKVIAILLLLSLFLIGCDAGEGFTECWGEYQLTDSGEHTLVQEDRPLYMTDGSEEGKLTANVLECEKVADYSKLG